MSDAESPRKLTPVKEIGGPQANVIDLLRDLLKQAEAGDIVAVACAYELRGGYSGHAAAFGEWGNRPLVVGKLQVLATQIVLNECLEWQPNG